MTVKKKKVYTAPVIRTETMTKSTWACVAQNCQIVGNQFIGDTTSGFAGNPFVPQTGCQP